MTSNRILESATANATAIPMTASINLMLLLPPPDAIVTLARDVVDFATDCLVKIRCRTLAALPARLRKGKC